MSLNTKPSFPILPTLAGFAAAQFTGYLWYGPFFGKTWMKAMKEIKPNFQVDTHSKAPVLYAAGMWLTSSVCFTTMVAFWNRDNGLLNYLCLAHTAWLGFSLPTACFCNCLFRTAQDR